MDIYAFTECSIVILFKRKYKKNSFNKRKLQDWRVSIHQKPRPQFMEVSKLDGVALSANLHSTTLHCFNLFTNHAFLRSLGSRVSLKQVIL